MLQWRAQICGWSHHFLRLRTVCIIFGLWAHNRSCNGSHVLIRMLCQKTDRDRGPYKSAAQNKIRWPTWTTIVCFLQWCIIFITKEHINCMKTAGIRAIVDVGMSLTFDVSRSVTCAPGAHFTNAGNILCMRPANERWRYTVKPSLIGCSHTQNDPSSSLWDRGPNFVKLRVVLTWKGMM